MGKVRLKPDYPNEIQLELRYKYGNIVQYWKSENIPRR